MKSPKRAKSRRVPRRLSTEPLERRDLLAIDFPFQNPAQPNDINRDLRVTPRDALNVINFVARRGVDIALPSENLTGLFPDANGSDSVSPSDALQVINFIGSSERTLSARLAHDSAPDGTNLDFLTNRYDLEFGITGSIGGERLELRVNGESGQPFIDVGAFVDGELTIDSAVIDLVAGSPLPDGEHQIESRVAGQTDSLSFAVEVDRAPPELALVDGPELRTEGSRIRVNVDDAVSPSRFQMETFVIVDAVSSEELAIADVTASLDGSTLLTLSDPLTEQGYELGTRQPLIDAAGNVLDGGASVPFVVADPTGVAEFRPHAGERLVRTTREIRINLDEPIDGATVNAGNVFVIAGGASVDGRLHVASDRMSIQFFPDEPLPTQTRVRLVVVGDEIVGDDGLALDADGDDQPGGTQEVEFTTLGLTPVLGTSISGFVYDSTTSTDSIKVPIVGATLTVEGLPSVMAVTDAQGAFTLQDTPGTEFYVQIDGSTSTSAPEGFHYVGTSKPFHPEAGAATELNKGGVPFDIFLPLAKEGDAVSIVSGESTTVGFSENSLDVLAGITPDVPRQVWEQLSIEVPPDSLFFADGSPASELQIFPLHNDRIPAPLPSGLNSSIVFSVDAGGAEDFDVPARITYPNVDGLSAGEKVFLYSFDHDQGNWRPTGTMTVSDDETVLVSDDGVQTVGWRTVSNEPGVKWEDKAKGHTTENISKTFETAFRNNIASYINVISIAANFTDVLQDAVTTPGKVIPFIGQGITLAAKPVDVILDVVSSGLDVLSDSIRDEERTVSISEFTAAGMINAATGETLDFIPFWGPGIDFLTEWQGVVLSVVSTVDGLRATRTENRMFAAAVVEWTRLRGSNVIDNLDRAIDFTLNAYDTTTEIATNTVEFVADTVFDTAYHFYEFGGAASRWIDRFIGDENASSAEGESTLSDEELTARLLDAIDQYKSSVDRLTGLGYESLQEAFDDTWRQLETAVGELSEIVDGATTPSAGAYYAIEVSEELVLRGRLDDDGGYTAVLPPNSFLPLTLYDPRTGFINESFIRTGDSGTTQRGERLILEVDEQDRDNDGVPDKGEFVVGTNPDLADTNGDGVSDLAELLANRSPCGSPEPTSCLFSNLSLRGDAYDVYLKGSSHDTDGLTAFVATGARGLSVVDVSDPQLPILISDASLPGVSTDVVVDSHAWRAALAAGGRGVHLVDTTDPARPSLIKTVGNIGFVDAVEVFGDIAFAVGSETTVIDLRNGEVLQQLDLGAPVEAIAREGSLFSVTTADGRLHVVDYTSGFAIVRGSVDLIDDTKDVFVANGIAYVANGSVTDLKGSPFGSTLAIGGYSTIDISDPDDPVVISDVDTPSVSSGNLKTVLDGSGLAVVAGGFRGIEIHDASDPAVTYDFLTRIPTPGTARSVTLSGGYAYVADGTGGLSIAKFRETDRLGTAPTVSILTDAVDVDPSAPGIQVFEGTTVNVRAVTDDDVQVRDVTLIVDGRSTISDVTYPFDFAFQVPELTAEQSTVSIQVQATDTGGNKANSTDNLFTILEDTQAPFVTAVQLALNADGDDSVSIFDIEFNEALDTRHAINVRLDRADDPVDGESIVVEQSQIAFRGDDRIVQLTIPAPAEGNYALRLDESTIFDRAGNVMGGGIFEEIVAISEATAVWANEGGGLWSLPSNWRDGVIPGPDDLVLIDGLNPGAEVVVGAAKVAGATVRGKLKITNSGVFEAGIVDASDAMIELSGARIRNTVFNGGAAAEPLRIVSGILDGVTLNIPAHAINNANVTINNHLILNEVFTLASTGTVTQMNFVGTQMLDGVGSVVFSGTPTTPFQNRLIMGATSTIVTVGDDITIGHGLGQVAGLFDFQGTLDPGPEGILNVRGITNSTGVLELKETEGEIRFGGIVKDLVIRGPAGTRLLQEPSQGLTLDGVTLEIETLIRDGETLKVVNGLMLESNLYLDSLGRATNLTFEGSQSLLGSGSIEFTGAAPNSFNRVLTSLPGTEVEIGEGITIGGGTGNIQSFASGTQFVFRGTVFATLNSVITLTNVDLTMGTLRVEIDEIGSGNDPGRIDGGGTFALPGILDIVRPSGFVPAEGDLFRVIEAQTLIDDIDTVHGSTINGITLTPLIENGDLSLLAEDTQ
ncbi:MAG: Ig-like domain-containing protein [Planctomycetota bacterium]